MDGLLGKKLSHSFSPAVHKAFGNADYRLIETEDPVGFLKGESFCAVNVTIPYKETLIPFLDGLDDVAAKTKSVNLIIKDGSKLMGYNTDYFGLEAALKFHGLSLKNKRILILGNGGAARTAFQLALDADCLEVVKMVRHLKGTDEISYEEIDKVRKYDIIINATPAGMFPDNEGFPPVALDKFEHLEAVMDLIYNPLTTRFMTQAKRLGIPAFNGLYMLVTQAKKSHELTTGKEIPDSLLRKIYGTLRKKAANFVLVGLPLSGKSLYARQLADFYHKIPVDTDHMIESESRTPISEIFRSNGEPYFRALEADVIDRIYRLGNQVISTGGGMIENPDLMAKLKQNGIVIFLDKDPKIIMEHKIMNRPLIQTPEDILKLDARRRPLYEGYADIIIKIDKPQKENLEEIEAKLNEYLSH